MQLILSWGDGGEEKCNYRKSRGLNHVFSRLPHFISFLAFVLWRSNRRKNWEKYGNPHLYVHTWESVPGKGGSCRVAQPSHTSFPKDNAPASSSLVLEAAVSSVEDLQGRLKVSIPPWIETIESMEFARTRRKKKNSRLWVSVSISGLLEVFWQDKKEWEPYI